MALTQGIIHLDNLRWNIRCIKSIIDPSIPVCFAVKGDAYGHGAVHIAKTAESEGITWFGVARTEEAVELREAGIESRILLYGPPPRHDIATLSELGVSVFIGDGDTVRMWSELLRRKKRILQVHLKIDTGMGRIGCRPDEAALLAGEIDSAEGLELEGTCTHFPCSDTDDTRPTREQLALFLKSVESVRARGIDPGILHTANSGAVLGIPETHLDMVRPGIILYGYYPSRSQKKTIPVKPVFELVTEVTFIKRVQPGTPISYGSTYTAATETDIVTLPVGYADGLSRLLSNNGEVLIQGKRYPVAGRVCMDQIMVDVGKDHSIHPGERAVIFGPDPDGPSAEDIAFRTGTISYEVTCGITKRVPRIYTGAPVHSAKSR